MQIVKASQFWSEFTNKNWDQLGLAMKLELLGNIITLFAAGVVPYSYIKHLTSRTTPPDWVVMDSQFSYVEKKFRSLFEKVSLLENHENKYFHSLNDAGLSELISIQNALSRVIEDCRNLRKEKNLEGVTELLKFLNNPFSKVYPKLVAYTTADLRFLDDWEKRADDLVISCVVKLGIMSSKFEKTDNPQRERRPTVHTLEELKRVLSEHRTS